MLSEDVKRLKELSKRNPEELKPSDFNRLDFDHMLKMAEKIVPKKRVESQDHEGFIRFKDIPDFSKISPFDEINLLMFLKKNKAL